MPNLYRFLLGLSIVVIVGLTFPIAQQVLPPVANSAMVCAYNGATSTPTGTSGQFIYVQCDVNGRVKVTTTP
jgi:hypothetical protein